MTRRARRDTEEITSGLEIVLQQKSSNLEKLKVVMQQVFKVNEHFKGLPQPVSNDLIRCACHACSQVFYITSNLGNLRCAHCGNRNLDMTWGGLRVAFVPEEPSE